MKNRQNYAVNWHDTIRPAILKRDGYKCTNCGVKQRSRGYYDKKGKFVECDLFMEGWAVRHGFKVRTIWLQVAHLDQNPANNTYSNLTCFCPSCHMMYDNTHNVAKRLANRKKK